jgi:hypothetical protein
MRLCSRFWCLLLAFVHPVLRLSAAIGFKAAVWASCCDMILALFAQVPDNSDLHRFILLLI